MNFTEQQKWRYATKQFDSTLKVSDEDINTLKEAVQLAASSYGLQPYKVQIISNTELREALKPLCWNQSQVTDASHFFVFCNMLNVDEEYVQNFTSLKAEVQGIPADRLERFSTFVAKKMAEKSADEMQHWTAKQAYIALGNLMNACAAMQIDSCPMEGFDRDAVNDLLDLKKQGLNACVMAAVGYRSKDDAAQHIPKVRQSQEDLFHIL